MEQHQQHQQPPHNKATVASTTTVPSAAECVICAEKMNRSTRNPIGCQYCDFVACRTCIQTYILSEPITKCMNSSCGREWTRYFLARHFPKSFMSGKYRSHISMVLFDAEKALLPDAQNTVELMKRVQTLSESIREVEDKINTYHRERNNLIGQKNIVQININERLMNRTTRGTQSDNGIVQFIRHCPANDCRGFLSTAWKCGMCEQWACPICHEIKGPERNSEHTCDPILAESAKAIAAETRNCPTCATPIFRIHGCDQMWCTICNNAFSWRTGAKQSGVVHNPHYFEYLQNRNNGNGNGNNPAIDENRHDLLCGWQYISRPTIQMRRRLSNQLLDKVSHVTQRILHIEHIDLNHFVNRNMTNEMLRVNYLNREIDETVFRMRVVNNLKKKQKMDECHQLLTMWINMSKEIVIRIFPSFYNTEIPETEKMNKWTEFTLEHEELTHYFVQQAKEIAETFQSSAYMSISLPGMVLKMLPYQGKKRGTSSIESTNTIVEI